MPWKPRASRAPTRSTSSWSTRESGCGFLRCGTGVGELGQQPAVVLGVHAGRVATCIAEPEVTYPGGSARHALAIARDFFEVMIRREFIPNSPTLMNALLTEARQNGV